MSWRLFFPNFFQVIGCVAKLNRKFRLNLTYHDINYVYNCQTSLKLGWYFKIHQGQVRLIFCLPNSNKVSEGDILMISRNWHTGKVSCPTSFNTPNLSCFCPIEPFIYLCTLIYCSLLTLSFFRFEVREVEHQLHKCEGSQPNSSIRILRSHQCSALCWTFDPQVQTFM